MTLDYITEMDVVDDHTDPIPLVECYGCEDVVPEYDTVRTMFDDYLCIPCAREGE